jgi:hypothetical protein
LTGIVLSTSRVPTISGSIFNALGEPVAAADVRAYRVRYTPAGRKFTFAKNALTNDFGEYRLFGLDPGEYYVSASYGELAAQAPGVRLTPNLPKPDEGLTTMYFPGVLTPYEAATVHPAAGVDVNSINIVLKDIPRFNVRGHVSLAGVNGFPIARLALVPSGVDSVSESDFGIGSGANGAFEVRGVSPGQYLLVAKAEYDGRAYFSDVTDVTVSDRDISNLQTPLFRAVTVSGRISAEASSNSAPLSGLTVSLHRSDLRREFVPQRFTGGTGRVGANQPQRRVLNPGRSSG